MRVFKICKVRMSTRAMSDLMYAVIMTDSEITSTFGIGIKNYTRKQNAYNNVDVMIKIYPDHIDRFIELTGLTLIEPQTIKPLRSN